MPVPESFEVEFVEIESAMIAAKFVMKWL